MLRYRPAADSNLDVRNPKLNNHAERKMATHTYFVFTNAEPGREAEFEAWYDNRHIPDLLRVPGVVSARRFELSSVQRTDMTHPYRYVTLYEIDGNDLGGIIAEIARRAGTSEMPLSDAMHKTREMHFYRPCNSR